MALRKIFDVGNSLIRLESVDVNMPVLDKQAMIIFFI